MIVLLSKQQELAPCKRAVIYCRVSTDKQEQDGESLEYQEEKSRRYAELHDIEVIVVLREVKSGFIHYSHRQQLTIARQLIRDRMADMVIVWDLRRFSRNFVHSSMIFEEIESVGAEIISVSENIDNSLTGKLIRSILAWSAESEREKILEYANRHWQTRIELGLPIGTGYTPYGWAWGNTEKTIYILESEEAMVRFSIFHMFVELDMSLRAIVHKLTEDGVLPPSATRSPNRKTASMWTQSTVHGYLKDPANIGTLIICKKKNILNEKGRLVRRAHPDKKVIAGGLPAIVPVHLYERAQRKLATNKVEKSHLLKDPEAHLLRGHAYCGTCGRRLCTRILRRGEYAFRYYYCSNRKNKYGQCPDIPMFRADMADSIAWKDCCQLFKQLEAIQSHLELEIEQSVNTLLEDMRGRDQIAELQAVIEFARQERTKHTEASYMYNLISQDIQVKEEQLARYREECQSADSIAKATALYKSRMMEFLGFLNVMRGKYHKATFREKRNALDVLGMRVSLAALKEEDKKRGKVPTEDNLQSRMTITYVPSFTGVSP